MTYAEYPAEMRLAARVATGLSPEVRFPTGVQADPPSVSVRQLVLVVARADNCPGPGHGTDTSLVSGRRHVLPRWGPQPRAPADHLARLQSAAPHPPTETAA